MYFLFCEVKTNLSRCLKILLAVVFFLFVACSMLLGFISIKLFITDIKNDYQKIVAVSLDKDLANYDDSNLDEIVVPSQKLLQELSKNVHVKNISQTAEVYISAPELIFPKQKIKIDPYFFLENQSSIRRFSYVRLLAYNDYSLREMFDTLSLEIVSGSPLEDDEGVLISREFAKLNNLKVGDVVKLDSIFTDYSFDARVGGIYDNPEISQLPIMITSIDAVLAHFSDDFIQINTSYVLKDGASYDEFTSYANEKILPDMYVAGYDEISYNRVVAPLKLSANRLKNLSATWIILGCFAIFMYLIRIRSRKVFQLTIMKLVGFTSRKIIFITAVELCVIILIAMFIAMGLICWVVIPLLNYFVSSYNYNVENSIAEASQIIGFSFVHDIDFGGLREYWFAVLCLYVVVFFAAFIPYVSYILRFDLTESIVRESNDFED